MSSVPNINTYTITASGTEQTMPVNTSRTYLMLVNNGVNDATLKVGNNSNSGVTIAGNGGHIAFPKGVLGPLYVTGNGDIECLSTVNEAADIT